MSLNIIVGDKIFEVERFSIMNFERIAHRVGWWYTTLYNRKYILANENNNKIMEEIKIKQDEILELRKKYEYSI